MKIITIFGTRPEAIKMAPLIKCLKSEKNIYSKILVTGQHRDMLDQVLNLFEIIPDYDLNIMTKNQSLTEITSKIINGLEPILLKEKPDLILVHGDTNTTFAASLSAFYQKIMIGHVEAGLRTYDKYAPYPEEINRQLTSKLVDLHFAPTKKTKDNLLAEGISNNKIFITGNTVIDAFLSIIKKPFNIKKIKGLENVDFGKKIILVTTHRRENLGKNMKNIFLAIKKILNNIPNNQVIFPIHKNPEVRKIAYSILKKEKNIFFIEPLDYQPFINVMKKSYLILTDSGGIQEEAPSIGKPVLVLRKITERPESISSGTVLLAGVDENSIFETSKKILTDSSFYKKISNSKNPYGDGFASKKIIEIIKKKGNI